jgi:hypothetical protein
MPYQTGNITHNFVDNMQILNLQNVLGHNALRPHEQEGYLVGSLLGWDKPGRSNNLAVRLLGKVRILLAGMTDTADFWGDYDSIPNHILLPPASDDPYRRWLERNGLQPDSV